MSSLRLLSTFYATAPPHSNTPPHQTILTNLLSNAAQRDIILKASARRPSVAQLAETHLLRFQLEIVLPSVQEWKKKKEEEDGEEAELVDTTIPLTFSTAEGMSDTLRASLTSGDYAVFITNVVIQDAVNPMSVAMGVRSNVLAAGMWGLEPPAPIVGQDPRDRAVQLVVSDDMLNYRDKTEQGFLCALSPNRAFGAQSAHVIRRVSKQERSQLYQCGGCCFVPPHHHDDNADNNKMILEANAQRLRHGIVSLPSQPDWVLIETTHILYEQLRDYQLMAQLNAFNEDPGNRAQIVEEDQEVPIQFTLQPTNTEYAYVPSALMESFIRMAPEKLFFYMIREVPFSTLKLSVQPINHTWAELYTKQEQEQEEQEQDQPMRIQLILDLKVVVFPRAALFDRAVCRIPEEEEEEIIDAMK